MSTSFFEGSAQRLDDLVKPGILCAFDFDGTIAPLAMDPDRVSVPSPVSRRMAHLCNYAPVAVITGRSVSDVKDRMNFTPDFIVGNHGLEGMPGWNRSNENFNTLCQTWAQTLALALEDQGTYDRGIHIENKGCSLSVHYRMVRDQHKAETQLAELLPQLLPSAQVIAGKCVFNLLPTAEVNKGVALNELMRVTDARSAIYVGDDVTDEDVFRLQRPDLLSVRIGREEMSSAEFFLHHRLGMVQLLDELIRRLRESV